MLQACSPVTYRSLLRLTCAVALIAVAGCASSPTPYPGGANTPREQIQTGIRAHQDRDYENAIGIFKTITEQPGLEPEMAVSAWTNLGASYDAASRYNEALDALNTARELAPDNALVLFNLGRVNTNLGHFDAARDNYQKAAQLQPDNSDIPYNLGILYEIYLNQPDQALSVYHHYVEMDGPEATLVKGWITAIEQRNPAK